MARNSTSQRQKTQTNPLVLGTFGQTSLRYLKGTLGALWKPVGYADSDLTSNGGIGGGTYNHWFQINLAAPGWIILAKGPPRPNYIQVSAYDLNKNPIQGNPIFQADSIVTNENGDVYIPYLNTFTSAQSDLYDTYSQVRLDRGDDRYFALDVGSYLICISSTRNETLAYELGVVIEFTTTQAFFELEDTDGSVCLQETELIPGALPEPISLTSTLTENAYSIETGTIAEGVTLTVDAGITWTVLNLIPAEDFDDYLITLEPGNDFYYETLHDHSLSAWQTAWSNEHQETDKFPEIFVPLTNRP